MQKFCGPLLLTQSLSSRRAWIEIFRYPASPAFLQIVALLTESVDRNPFLCLIVYAQTVALLTESVDRNTTLQKDYTRFEVALLTESVDRNDDNIPDTAT